TKKPIWKKMFLPLINIPFVILLIGFGIAVGSFYALSTLMDQIVSPNGYSSVDSGIFGVIIVVSGIFGALSAGIFTIRFYRLWMKLAAIGLTGSMLCFTLALQPNNAIILYIVCVFIGIFGTSTQ